MARRKTRNRTGIPRIGVRPHDAWISFVCVRCHRPCVLRIGETLLTASDAYESAAWKCDHCRFIHTKDAQLPFKHWPTQATAAGGISARRFWHGFFRSITEHAASYWKQCNACGRVQPFANFSRHVGWGPLERQMECRGCKGAINAKLNPRRTKEQLHEGSARRRAGDLLLEGQHERLNHNELFRRFGGRCFRTGKLLKIQDRATWAIDHILPSRYLYPLTAQNAALLSRQANENKRDRWPSDFYTPSQLKRLAEITGSDLSILASDTPVINPRIDVNACVNRALRVREQSRKLPQRIAELKRFLEAYGLVSQLSAKNRKLLGF